MKISRRSFFSKAWLAPFLLPASLLAEGLQPSDNGNYQFNYKGYRIRWTGWKMTVQSEDEIGQWLAVTMKEPWKRIYSSVPGACDFYSPGMVFDVGLRHAENGSSYARGATFRQDWDQVVVTSKSTQSVRDDEQAQGLRRLCRFIDVHGEKSPWSQEE